MGLELIAIGVSIAVSAAASAYAIYQGRKSKSDKMAPVSMDSFNMTRTQEGLAIPLVYGRVRIPGNIIWWGDLRTVPIKAKGGGKGMGGKRGIQGYKYYVSCWQAISLGKISLIKTYVNDKEAEIEAIDTIWNDGTLTTYPTNVPKANSLPGIAHIYYNHWYIGDNVQNIPNVHFVVERILPVDIIPNANLNNGSNPAAVIYDLLLMGGVSPNEINIDSFKTAASGWDGMGINLVFSEQTSVSDAIENVLKFVDAVVYVDGNGKYAIQAFLGMDPYVAEIIEEEINDFSMNRKTWGQLPNDFSATFLDETLDFSQRVIHVQNPAAIRAALTTISQSIDLKCFRDVETASRRLFEIMLQASYPAAEIKFKTNLKYSTLLPGHVIRINYPSLGIEADFRITTIDNTTIDKNEINISALQKIDGMFNTINIAAGGSSWQNPSYGLIALTHISIFELPFNYTTLEEPTYLLLAAREKLIETGFAVLKSNTANGDYELAGIFTTYSQYGILEEEYSSNTHNIDDTIGILYTPYKFDPDFITQSRANLFGGNKVAICGNEIMGFEKVIPEGLSSYRLLGIVRGVLNTPIENHSKGSNIWLTEISEENILKGVNTSSFWLKFLPIFYETALDASLISPIHVTYSAKAITPIAPSVRATRTNSTVAFELFPYTKDKLGTGTQPEDTYLPPEPSSYSFEGDFEVDDGFEITYQTSINFSLTLIGQTTVTIKHRLNGRLSEAKTIIIGAQDATYYA